MTTRLLLIILLSLSSSANAEVFYRGRYQQPYVYPGYPTTVRVCLVPFNGSQINAIAIQSISVVSRVEKVFFPGTAWYDPGSWVDGAPYPSLRVQLVNGNVYLQRTDEPRAAEAQLVKSIRELCP